MKFINFLLIMIIFLGCNIQTSNQKEEESMNDNAGGIKPWSENSRYWEYEGKPVLLLEAFNHGHNPFIDGSTLDDNKIDSMQVIVSQIQEMADAGGNTLRCVLDPCNATSISIESYQKNSKGLYDLNKPNGLYWDRLSTFIAEAEKRDVIVELEIWDRFDWFGKNWEANPFNPKNNINYAYDNTNLNNAYERAEIYFNHPMALGVPDRPSYDTASMQRKENYDRVRKYQEIFVSKVYEIAKNHGNVLYNMNNETAENPAWGEYWIKYLKNKANKDNINIVCTNMQDGIFELEESKELKHQFQHPEIYDYLDISQINSRLRDGEHWHAVSWIAERAKENNFLLYMTKLYGSDDREPEPWAIWRPGDTDNAIEEWWRNLIAGVAGVRFHRPHSGIGLSNKAKACIKATRLVEEKVKFWDVEPNLDLLSERDDDEAYLAAKPVQKYILYFTLQGGGSVGLDLEEYEGLDFNISWFNIDTGKPHSESSIAGGGIHTIKRPDDTAHWVATILQFI